MTIPDDHQFVEGMMLLTWLLIAIHSSVVLASWQLVWADEFDGPEIDDSKWSFELGNGCDRGMCGWGNSELQIYTNSSDNAFITNGHLIIQAINKHKIYTSARMTTLGLADWRFGKFEIKAKFPKGGSTWPYIWMLPTYATFGEWPRSGSLDIATMRDTGSANTMEYVAHFGSELDLNYGVRKPVTEINSFDETLETNPSFADDFHIFSLVKTEDNVKWFVDGEKVHELNRNEFDTENKRPIPYPFNERFHLLLNVAVGGKIVSVSDTSLFPQRLEIDFVRVYEWTKP